MIENKNMSNLFLVTNIVKPGCVLTPTPLDILIVAMLLVDFHTIGVDIQIKFRINGKLFNHR